MKHSDPFSMNRARGNAYPVFDPTDSSGRVMSRRTAIKAMVTAVGAVAAGGSVAGAAASSRPGPLGSSPKRYNMKKSINLWALPYPERMTLRECLVLAKEAGFDGVELNYDLESEISPESGTNEFKAIREMADEVGIAISGLCSFLFWPYPLTSNDRARRERGQELAGKMVRAAHDLGTDNLLVVPGAVSIPWRDDHEPVPNDVCDRRAREAVGKLVPEAESLGVNLNIENIFYNGYILSPMEMVEFVDSFGSDRVHAHFDTGNIMIFQSPEHWIPILGKRIRNTHFKEFNGRSNDSSLENFRPLLDGTTNWPAVMEALEAIDYTGYLTFEYFQPYPHYPAALVHHTSDSLDRMMGRK